MKSNIFSRGKFAALYRWAIRRNRPIIVVFCVLLTLGPIFSAYSVSQLSDLFTDSSDSEVYSAVAAVILSGMIFLTMVLTFISAVRTFSFTHDKRSTDMFGALPCDRGTMYLAHLAGGLTSICVPYIITVVIVMAMSGGAPDTIGEDFKIILFTLLMIIASYTFTALISYCCGTTADTVIISLVINGVWMLLVVLYYVFLDSLIPGAAYDSIFNTPILILFTPYGFGYFGVWAVLNDSVQIVEGSSALFVVTLIWQIVFTAATAVGAYYMAKKRKAESAQNGFAVAWLPMFVQAIASVGVGAFTGLMFSAFSVNDDFSIMFVYAFWYVVLSAIAFVILQIIFHRGLRGKWLRGLMVYAVTAAAALVLVLGMCFGLGIDTYVPNASSVKAVSIGNGDVVFTEQEDIENVAELHSIFAENLHEVYEYPYYFGSDTVDSSSSIYSPYSDFSNDYPILTSFDFEFEYSRRFGTDVSREYDIYDFYSVLTTEELDRMEELVWNIFSSNAYKEYDCSLLFDEDTFAEMSENVQGIEISTYTLMTSYYYDYDDGYGKAYSYEQTGSAYLDIGDTEFLNDLYDALKTDVTADEDYIPGNMISEEFADTLGDIYYVVSFYVSSTYSAGYSVVVKSSYTNTMDLISDSINSSYSGNYNYTYSDDYGSYI